MGYGCDCQQSTCYLRSPERNVPASPTLPLRKKKAPKARVTLAPEPRGPTPFWRDQPPVLHRRPGRPKLERQLSPYFPDEAFEDDDRVADMLIGVVSAMAHWKPEPRPERPPYRLEDDEITMNLVRAAMALGAWEGPEELRVA